MMFTKRECIRDGWCKKNEIYIYIYIPETMTGTLILYRTISWWCWRRGNVFAMDDVKKTRKNIYLGALDVFASVRLCKCAMHTVHVHMHMQSWMCMCEPHNVLCMAYIAGWILTLYVEYQHCTSYVYIVRHTSTCSPYDVQRTIYVYIVR